MAENYVSFISALLDDIRPKPTHGRGCVAWRGGRAVGWVVHDLSIQPELNLNGHINPTLQALCVDYALALGGTECHACRHGLESMRVGLNVAEVGGVGAAVGQPVQAVKFKRASDCFQRMLLGVGALAQQRVRGQLMGYPELIRH